MADIHQQLRQMFRRQKVVDMEALTAVVALRSRRSLFRDLAALGYLTSYTHTGRYYTLRDVPNFDEHGLWLFNDIGFSRAGTLKSTLVVEVERSPAGRTHAELQQLLRVRVHNTLLLLVQQARLARQLFAGVHLYVSADTARAVGQVAGRQELARQSDEAARPIPAEQTIEILVETLRFAPRLPAAAVVAERLAARGLHLLERDVEQVFATYGLVPGKKRTLR